MECSRFPANRALNNASTTYVLQSGKTCICNYLAEATESSGGEYHPTQGVRILELEVEGEEETGRTLLVEVELWDCSGSKQWVGPVFMGNV